MIEKNKRYIGMVLLVGLMLVGLLGVIGAYQTTYNPQLSQFQGSGDMFALEPSSLQFDPGMCEAGQDFVIQLAPFGCNPAVVRTDLLEEQNVPVYCQLSATKINPLMMSRQ